MSYARILGEVRRYYDGKLKAHGPTARGVDWNSSESQRLRFSQLAQICPDQTPFSINDYGCGYGALIDYLNEHGYKFQYRGFDISERMIRKARELHRQTDASFGTHESTLRPADYTVASGIFNVRLKTSAAEWEDFVLAKIEVLNQLSTRAFAFNLLTSYSDREFMRPDLYYGDPLFFFDYCKQRYSRFVSVIHDYPLYEFTVLVRKD